MTKILWHSNAPWFNTGYGVQTALMTSRLKQHGHDVAISAFCGLQGGPLGWGDITLYPNNRDPYGNELIQGHARNHFNGDIRAGLVITLIDVWVLAPQVWRAMNTCCWVPVDHDPAPPLVTQFFEQSNAIPIAMSRWGAEQLKRFDPLYVPHGVNTQTLRPVDQRKAREAVGLPQDRYVVGMVAANKGNPSRKSFPEAFTAFAELMKRRDDAHLYLHTEAHGLDQGLNLPKLLAACGIPPDRVSFCDQYRYGCMPFNETELANVYSAMDVLLNPAAGEGFGVTILEAQACGTPVIVTDFSAMPEVGKVGWLVGADRTWTYQESWQVRPRHEELVWALTEAGEQAGRMREDAREHALTYDADRVALEHLLPALAEVQERYKAREPQGLPAAVAA